jgi:hypothetical protein
LVIANYLSRNVSVLLGRCGTFPTHPPGSDQFTLVGNMTAQRSGHLATRLADGRVLITGATNGLLCCPFGGVPATAELYNPATQMFTPAGVMSSPRGLHAAALLSNGKVLITGGTPSPSSAELYDPNIGSFTPTPNMNGGHFFHTATLLSDGRVLIVGGPGSAELYDPISGTFHLTGSLITIRQLHTATLLADGNVLIAGGRGTSGDLNTAEVYSPFTGAFLPTGNMMATRLFFAAGLLANGQVLVTGDYFGQATSELYDRLSGIFITNGVMNTPRYNHTETPLPNGKVLVAGGHTPNNPLPAGVLSDAELYDPLTKMFSSTVRLNNGRYVHTATLLSDGKILIAGGVGINGPLATAELYTGASERDDVPPTINCPQNLVTSTDPGTCTANVTYTVTASDNLPGVAVVCTPPPGSVFHKGTSFVTCAATDAAGNTNGCSFAVTVQDSEPPQIVCPTNIVLGCNVDLLVRVQFSVSSRDNCDSLPTMTSMPASGAGFPIGTTTVMNTATDGSGNRSTCTFSVTRAPLPFSGFLPPIGGADANGGTFANPIRSFKSDSTIPVKFNASCNGSPVTAGVHRLRVAKYSDSTTPGAHIDAITQDAATSGNGFRLVDGQWHFNLDTKATGMSSGIWLLMATLSDGSQHSVWIQLK